MTPLLLGAAGLVALVAGGLVLRTFGAAYRIGRLLATAPTVTVAEANAIAATGRPTYVRIAGRIDAEDEFEDADHRPLVFRRVRLETRAGRSWRPFENHRRSVPFTVNEGLDSIGIDVDALDAGLIVVPRESVGLASDMPDRVPERYPADTPVRVRIEQISSVEHAIVVGVPVAIDDVADGPPTDAARANTAQANTAQANTAQMNAGPSARMTAGRGRPLILTVLEPPEAMRILAGGDAERTRLAAGLLGAGAILVAGALLWTAVSALLPAIISALPGTANLVAVALAASGEPSTAPAGGDPRSNGQGPGIVGTPGLAILGVISIAIAAIVVTTIYVRLTARADVRPDVAPRSRDDGAGRTRRR
ncbi:MAG: hypothetical protein ABIZ72_04240 [Candidatus Limnocylindrales bacterium]